MQNRGADNSNFPQPSFDGFSDCLKDSFEHRTWTKPQTAAFATPEKKGKARINCLKQSFLSPSPFPTSQTQPFSASPNRNLLSDRFIPIRSGPLSKNLFEVSDEFESSPGNIEPFSDEVQHKMKYTSLLENQLLDFKHDQISLKLPNSGTKINSSGTPEVKRNLSQFAKPKLLKFQSHFKEEKNVLPKMTLSPFMELEGEEEIMTETLKPFRKISKTPYKILDAPGLVDDYYIDLLHWSQRNYLAVSLLHSVWLFNVEKDTVNEFYAPKDSSCKITSVQWEEKGNTLALGDTDGNLTLMDLDSSKKIATIGGHADRINCISWNGSHIVSTASRDSMIFTRDLRAPNEMIMRHSGHKDEVCGLTWSPSGRYLASGGNDNKVFIWNLQKPEPEARFDQHTSAVKALAWSPHQHELLLTGGGYTDRRINMWNVLSSHMINSIETDSQVCKILFSKNSNEFVTTHGHPKSQIIVWKYPDPVKLCVLDDTQTHSQRILFLSDSPNGEDIVTGASDETLKFWNIFEKKPSKTGSFLFPSSCDLR